MAQRSRLSWRAYPALWLAGCLAGGIMLAASGALRLPFEGWLLLAAGAGTVAAVTLYREGRRLVSLAPLLRTAALGLGVLAAGGALFVQQQQLPASHVAHHVQPYDLHRQHTAERLVLLEGRLARSPSQTSSSTRFELRAHRLLTETDTFAVTGRVQAALWHENEETAARLPLLRQGDRVRLRGRLEPVPHRRNPADFDYGAHLKRRGIHASFHLRGPLDLAVLGRERRALDRIVVPTRDYVRRQIARHVPSEDGRSVLYALLLGDRSQIDETTRDRFVRSGLMHLLAVSGLHVLLVGMVLYHLLRPMLTRLHLSWHATEIARAAATVGLLLLYMLLTEARPSVVRAVVMAVLFIGGMLLQRPSQSLNTLGVAAIVLLLTRPAQLLDAGFQLSFSAVGAILLLNPLLTRMATRQGLPRNVLLTTVTSTVAATAGTLPVLLAHFGFASLAGLVLNLLAIPATALGLAAGLLMVCLGGWWSAPAELLGYAADAFLRALLWTATAGEATLGWAAVQTFLSSWFLLALVAALLTATQLHRPRRRWKLVALTLAVATTGVWMGLFEERPRLEVIFFDVGQGDAALVSLPGGQHLLVDAGPRNPFTDQGARTILPHLKRYGITRLDAVVITHPHSDHLGGLPSLLRGVPVERVLHNGGRAESALFDETLHLLDSLGVAHRALQTGDTLNLDPQVTLRALYPMPDVVRNASANDASVVLQLTYGRTAFLFTGDAEAKAERALTRHFEPLLASGVVKVGHHGSATSSSPALVRAALPDSAGMAVVSAGRRNVFGLPAPEVLARWHHQGARLHVTAVSGALWLRSDGRRIEPVAWR